jgi:hypothetical protein
MGSGIGGIYGNKGAIVARMVMDDTSLCFINVHLAAGQRQKTSRNADLAGIMEDKAILPPHDLTPFVHGGDGTGIMDHEMVILNGDLNVGFSCRHVKGADRVVPNRSTSRNGTFCRISWRSRLLVGTRSTAQRNA